MAGALAHGFIELSVKYANAQNEIREEFAKVESMAAATGSKSGAALGAGMKKGVKGHGAAMMEEFGRDAHPRAAQTGAAIGQVIGRGIGKGIQGAESVVTGAFSKMGELAVSVFHKAGSMAGAAFAATLKATGIGAVLGVAGFLGASLFKGFEHLSAIEDASVKLKALGYSGYAVQQTMQSVADAIKGTQYSTNDLIQASQTALMHNIAPGGPLTTYLKEVENLAAVSGKTIDEVSTALTRAMTKGTFDSRLLLTFKDTPVVSFLEKYLHLSPMAFAEAVKDGKITFAQFQAAMDAEGGGIAEAMVNTISGRFHQLMESLANVGSALIKPFFAGIPDAMGGLNDKMESLAKWITTHQPDIVNFFKSFTDGALRAAGDITSMLAALSRGIGGLLVGLGKLTGNGALQAAGKDMQGVGDAMDRWVKDTLPGMIEATDKYFDRIGQSAKLTNALGDSLTDIPDDKHVVIDIANAPEAEQKLKDLGFMVTHLPDGRVTITPKTDEAAAIYNRWLESQGKKPLYANVEPKVNGKPVGGLGTNLASLLGIPPGGLSTNLNVKVNATAGLGASLSGAGVVVPVGIASVSGQGTMQLGGNGQPGRVLPGATNYHGSGLGGYFGGGQMNQPHGSLGQVTIGPDGKPVITMGAEGFIAPEKSPRGIIQWAEPGTGGEAYIPLGASHRKRSMDLWLETGKKLGAVQSFAQGGISGVGGLGAVRALVRSLTGASSGHRTAYGMGGFSPSALDCSGLVSAVVNAYLGAGAFSSRMSTPAEGGWLKQRGFVMGRGPAGTLRVGWYGGGGSSGHTALTLPDGTNVESTTSHGISGVRAGAKAAGADSPIFINHAYLPSIGGGAAGPMRGYVGFAGGVPMRYTLADSTGLFGGGASGSGGGGGGGPLRIGGGRTGGGGGASWFDSPGSPYSPFYGPGNLPPAPPMVPQQDTQFSGDEGDLGGTGASGGASGNTYMDNAATGASYDPASASPIMGDYSSTGNPAYDKKIRDASQKIDDLNARVGLDQQRLDTAKQRLAETQANPKSKPSAIAAAQTAVDSAVATLTKTQRELSDATTDLSTLQASGGGAAGGGALDPGNPFSEITSGIGTLADLGISGMKESLLPPGFSDPSTWPMLKSAGGLMGFLSGLFPQGSLPNALLGAGAGAFNMSGSGVADSLGSLFSPQAYAPSNVLPQGAGVPGLNLPHMPGGAAEGVPVMPGPGGTVNDNRIQVTGDTTNLTKNTMDHVQAKQAPIARKNLNTNRLVPAG